MSDHRDDAPTKVNTPNAGQGGAGRDTQTHAPEAPPPSSKPPRGPSLAVIFAVMAAFAVALVLGTAFGGRMWGGMQKLWHGTFHSDVEVTDASGAVQYYTCGMHPWVILPKPGDCPICHMKLEPIDPAKFTGDVSISPLVVQNIGVRVQPVVTGPLVKTIRTVGTVDYAEPLVKDVNTKIGGWIEKLNVDQMGQQVKAGDPLFELYSPELYGAQEEYLLAYRNQGKVGADFVPDAAKNNKQLLESSRTKLDYYDITPEQIRELEKADKPAKTMVVRSPHTGVVIEKHANQGMKIEPGMRVYRIADLSKVWVMVTVYEYQLPYVQQGQTAIMTLPYVPGQTFQGKVVYVYPYLNEKVRDVKVRLEFDNAQGILKPGMFANVELRNTLARERVLAPRSAIIDTGKRQVAFVSLGEGRFEPRQVEIGVETEDGVVEIRDGLKPGEMVVTSGQFLIDSEARIREALAKMIKGDMAAEQKPTVALSGRSELKTLPEPAAAALISILDGYLEVGQRLAADTTQGMSEPSRRIASGIDALLKVQIPDDAHFWHKHEEAATIRGKALELLQANDLEQARLKYADQSVALAKLLRATGVPPTYGKEVQQLHCPMYQEGQGGSTWLQTPGAVRNPFYGSKMLECFDKREALPVTGGEPADSRQQGTTTKPVKQTGAVSDARQTHVDAALRAYLDLHAALMKDSTDQATGPLKRIGQSADALVERDADQKIKALAEKLASAARVPPKDLESLRTSFEILSNSLLELVKIVPPSKQVSTTLNWAYCPMVKKGWLQVGEAISNPYSASMRECGSVKEPLPAR